MFAEQHALTSTEWFGQTSKKWVTNRSHVPTHCNKDTIGDKVFSGKFDDAIEVKGRKHYELKESKGAIDRPGIRVLRPDFSHHHIDTGIKKIVQDLTVVKPRAERTHFTEKRGGSMNEFSIGKHCEGDKKNLSQNEYSYKEQMGSKLRVESLTGKRGGIGMASLGDKHYRTPEYSSGYYQDGGLAVGSTNPTNRVKGTGQKLINFYSNLDTTKKLNPNRMTAKQVERQEAMDADRKIVEGLFEWERTTLKEHDPNYKDPEDTSGDEADEDEPVVQKGAPGGAKKGKK